MEFESIIELSKNIAMKFDAINKKKWTIEIIALELSKQTGDLCKVILNHEGYYLEDRKEKDNYRAEKDDIANELVDIFHQIIQIALYYQIDLEKAHKMARNREQLYIDKILYDRKRQTGNTNIRGQALETVDKDN